MAMAKANGFDFRRSGLSLIENEQLKLTATYLNGLAIAFLAIGGISPLVGVVSHPTQPEWLIAATIGLIFVTVSVATHLIGRSILKGLQT